MPTRPTPWAAGPLARLRAAVARLWSEPSDAPPQAKGANAGALIAIGQTGQPVWAPRDYASFAREGMMQNAIVYRSVRMIAEAAASVPLLVYDGDHEITDHPLASLISRPCPGMTGTDLLEAWYGFLMVSGNAYMQAIGFDGEVRELHVLRPDRMKVVPGADGWPQAFEYSAGGEMVRIAGEAAEGVRPVLHLKLFHPANDHYGLSPIEAAASAIDLHNAAARWNKALLDNSARPSGALVYTNGGHMTGDQFERLKSELEASFQGTRNAGRPLLLEGGLDWKAMSLTPRDLDFMEAKHAAAREIALAIGVPPMLLGIPGDNTYANLAEANRALWRQTVLPLVARTARALSGWLSPAWGGGVRLEPDLDAVEALSPEREALWSRLERASFLTEAEKRAAAGYGPKGEGEAAADGAGPFDGKYNPDQPRDELGRWVEEGGEAGNGDPLLHQVSRRRAGSTGNVRLDNALARAREAVRRARELDPTWQSPRSFTSRGDIAGQIAHQEAVARAAEARYAEITRDALPGANPSWGMNRLRKELNDRGFLFEQSTRAPGWLYSNQQTGERIRIMERPFVRYRSDTPTKHYFQYYYRYRPAYGKPYGRHTPIPDKD